MAKPKFVAHQFVFPAIANRPGMIYRNGCKTAHYQHIHRQFGTIYTRPFCGGGKKARRVKWLNVMAGDTALFKPCLKCLKLLISKIRKGT